MKRLNLALLLLNLLLAAWFIGNRYWPDSARPAIAPLNVERLSLRQSANTDTQMPAPVVAAPTALCVEWRNLAPADFARVREQLKRMAGEHVMSFSEIPLNMRRWVIFPPLPSRAAAQAKLAELAAAGVADAYVIKDGEWANGLSLGLYANDEAAARRERELEQKGVLGTRIEALPKQGTAYYFLVRSEDSDTLKNLGEVRQAYPTSTLTRVACPP
jgi:hypothetical protein